MNSLLIKQIAPIAKYRLILTFLFATLALTGCVYSVNPYNQPSQEKLQIKSATPENYVVRVANQESHVVPVDGRVIVEVPRLERGCVTYLFGVVKVKDKSPYDVRAIGVYRENEVIRRLSLNDISKLTSDSEGYRIVQVD